MFSVDVIDGTREIFQLVDMLLYLVEVVRAIDIVNWI